jgi:hypothetical protein
MDMDRAVQFHWRIVHAQTNMFALSMAQTRIIQKREKLIGSAFFSSTLP